MNGAATDFILANKGEPAKGFKTTLPSLVSLTTKLLEHPGQHSGENISITRDMTQPTD